MMKRKTANRIPFTMPKTREHYELRPIACPCGCGKLIVSPLFGCQCSSLEMSEADELARRYNNFPALVEILKRLIQERPELDGSSRRRIQRDARAVLAQAREEWRPAASPEGPIYPPKQLFLRVSYGTATGADGTEYELTTNMHGDPIIRSLKTKKWWAPGWPRLIDLAIKDGINE